MRFATIALSAILSTALAGTALASGHGARLVEALDLSPAQQEVFEEFKSEMDAAREEVAEAREAFREAMKEELASGEPDIKALQRLADAKLDAERDSVYLAIEHMSALSETLTEEQLETLVELREQRQEHRGRGGGPRGEGEFDGKRRRAPAPE